MKFQQLLHSMRDEAQGFRASESEVITMLARARKQLFFSVKQRHFKMTVYNFWSG